MCLQEYLMLDDPKRVAMMQDLAKEYEEKANEAYMVCLVQIAACTAYSIMCL